MSTRPYSLLIAHCALLMCAVSAHAAFYIGQSQSGSGDGSSCANAKAVSFFNTEANWANPRQAGKIGPADTVFLCGNITSALTLQESGSSGGPITIDGAGATLGPAVSINTNDQSWWKLANLTWSDGATVTLLNILGGSNGAVDNAHADGISSYAVFLGQWDGVRRPDTMVIRNSFFRTGAVDYGNTQHDIVVTEGSNNIVLEGNHLEMRAGGTGSNAHDDCVQTWEKGGSSAGPPSGWTLRYNWIVMNANASNDRSWTMLENLTGTNYIYGNVFLGLQGAGSANGLNINSSGTGAVFNIYNNTFVAKGSASNNVLNLSSPGTANLANNIFHLQGQTALTGTMTKNRSFNHWFGTNIPSCAGFTGELCGTNPNFTDYANNNFSLQPSSVDQRGGTSLGSGPSGQQLNYGLAQAASWPNPAKVQRGSVWDRGAFVSGTASSGSACDLNQDGSPTVADVQLCANQAIGATACTTADINLDGVCTVVDVQRVVNAALGGACVTP